MNLEATRLRGIHTLADIEATVRALEHPTPAVKAAADAATHCWAAYDIAAAEARAVKLRALEAEELLLRAVTEGR